MSGTQGGRESERTCCCWSCSKGNHKCKSFSWEELFHMDKICFLKESYSTFDFETSLAAANSLHFFGSFHLLELNQHLIWNIKISHQQLCTRNIIFNSIELRSRQILCLLIKTDYCTACSTFACLEQSLLATFSQTLCNIDRKKFSFHGPKSQHSADRFLFCRSRQWLMTTWNSILRRRNLFPPNDSVSVQHSLEMIENKIIFPLVGIIFEQMTYTAFCIWGFCFCPCNCQTCFDIY